MRLKLNILTVALLFVFSNKATAQELNLGVKFGGGISNTAFTPATFHFSTVDNETAYISELTSEKLYTGLTLNIDYHTQNRWGVFGDLFTHTINYDFSAFSDAENESIGDPLLSTTHLTAALGVSYDIIQTKLIKPYIRAGFGINMLLRSQEREYNNNLFYFQKFTTWYNREVRNVIMFDHLNQQNNVYYSGHVGFGIKVYNVFIEGVWDQNLTDLDKKGTYGTQNKVLINVGVNLLRFDLVKKQKNED